MNRAQIRGLLVIVSAGCLYLVACDKKTINQEVAALQSENPGVEAHSILRDSFGKAVIVEGELIHFKTKTYSDVLGIRIFWLDDQRLIEPIEIELQVWGLSNDWVGQIGDWVRIGGFEGGYYTGAPRDAFPNEYILALPDLRWVG
ncbi:hypothetical protein ACFQY0_14745 [Haloferula chungangensis]|uniref:Uncharacterized protein n=1 Tax=Haloferula chungangensis TaxID=1048331 RepID=A0ABW2LA68_9BACT